MKKIIAFLLLVTMGRLFSMEPVQLANAEILKARFYKVKGSAFWYSEFLKCTALVESLAEKTMSPLAVVLEVERALIKLDGTIKDHKDKDAIERKALEDAGKKWGEFGRFFVGMKQDLIEFGEDKKPYLTELEMARESMVKFKPEIIQIFLKDSPNALNELREQKIIE